MRRDSKLLQSYYEIEISTALPWTLQEKKENKITKGSIKKVLGIIADLAHRSDGFFFGRLSFRCNACKSDRIYGQFHLRKIRKKKI